MHYPVLRELRTVDRILKAVGGLHYIKSNVVPYFSLTCEEYVRRGESWQEGVSGAAHDLLLRTWPELAPLVALHPSDIDGVPMHSRPCTWRRLVMSKYKWWVSVTGYIEQLYPEQDDLRAVSSLLPLAEVYRYQDRYQDRYQVGFRAVWFEPAMLLGVFDTLAEAKTAVEVLAPILEART